MKSAEYWAGRMERLNENMMQKADALLPELEKAYLRAEESLRRDIEAFYQRYATREGIALAEAKRLLSPEERKRFGLALEEYIAIGERVPVDPYWQGVLERTSVSVRVSRLEALRLQIRQQVEVLEGWKDTAMHATLGEIFRECQYQTAYEIQRGLGIGAEFATIDTRTISKALAKPWAADGKTFSERIWGDDRGKLLHTLDTTLTTGIITGEAPERIAAKIQKSMGVSHSVARRLVLTEGAAFSAMARQDCYAELGVGKYEFLATLDAKTCGTCAALDGQVFDLEDYAVGVTAPPLHPNDRCTTVPHFGDEGLAAGERAARGGNGKTYYVPADMTYPEWKKAFVEGGTEGLTLVGTNGMLEGQNLSKAGGMEVHYVGKLDKNIYRCVTEDITTDEVIITDVQIQHIKDRHPGDYERFVGYMKEIIADPDYILEANKPRTAFLLKQFQEAGEQFELILRLHTSKDVVGYKNSVITFLRVKEKRYQRYLRTKNILYKKE